MRKTIVYLLTATIVMIGFASCENLAPSNKDTNMTFNQWSVLDSYTYESDAEAYRIYAAVLVDGWNGEPYKLEYTIDGKAGKGATALYHLSDVETGAGMNYTEFDGNQPSGSEIVISSYNVTNKPELKNKNCGMARFLFPLLEPGTHTFSATLTNGYGQSITTEKTFKIVKK